MIYNGLIGESNLSCIAEETELYCTGVKKPANGYSIFFSHLGLWDFSMHFNTIVVADFEVTEAIFLSADQFSRSLLYTFRRIQKTQLKLHANTKEE